MNAISQLAVYDKNNQRCTPLLINYRFTMANGFADWLRAKLTEKGMRPADLWRATGVSKQNISKILNQKPPSQPTPETVERLAKGLGADVGEARNAAGYAAPITEATTVRELKSRLWEIGIHVEFHDEDDDSPEALERAKASIAALMNAIFPPKK